MFCERDKSSEFIPLYILCGGLGHEVPSDSFCKSTDFARGVQVLDLDYQFYHSINTKRIDDFVYMLHLISVVGACEYVVAVL